MTKIVIKFGGTSVGSIERITAAAKLIKKKIGKNNKIIVVVSAMSGKTNELVKRSEKISKKFNKRELDVLLASGEQVTSALLAGALNEIKVNGFTILKDVISEEECDDYKKLLEIPDISLTLFEIHNN